MRFLIDECLSPDLVEPAYSAGFEAYHVAHRRWSGRLDEQLFETAIAEGFVIVTNNRADFRELIGRVELHPGLVVLLPSVPRERQVELFRCALDEIARGVAAGGDMVNVVLEVDADCAVARSELPPIG